MIVLPLSRWILTRAPCSSSTISSLPTLSPSRKVARFSLRWWQNSSAISWSTNGSSRWRLSIRVTRTPSAAKMLAYSQPITPAPTTANVRGSRSRSRYLAAVMPDYRYRQTTATLDVRGFAFRAAGRQPTDLGWRAAFPDWQPADEKGDDAQLLPALCNGEIARLENPTIEDKETRPPPRYNEGTLIEAMQNAWRFVDDELLRERFKEAKGIGTPATRADIIGGLKRQGFLIAQAKNILPTETGLSLFGVLEQADPALVDPGVTAQLECSLDEVLIGKQEMFGAIDAVCDVAQRIIGKLTEGVGAGGPSLLGGVIGGDAGVRPPTPAMKRFADSVARQKGIKPPAGYTKSGTICRAFLDQHAQKKADGEPRGELGPKPASPAQMSLAEKIALERGIVIPDETK